MAITSQKGLKFPKVNFQKKANGQTSFYSAIETFTLPASANWDSSTLFAVQLDHLPALAREAIGQTIADPVLTCTTDSTTRVINYKRPDGTEPASGEVYLDIYNGVIQFNSADASKAFSITYYVKGDLVDHNAMNRIWESGHSYVVGDEPHHDYSDLQECINNAADGDSIKLLKDITTTGITVNKKLRINFNNKRLIKSGSLTSSRGFNTSEDFTLEECVFSGWDESGDICVYTSSDKLIILFKNNAIGQTQLTNASSVCTNCIVQGNLPLSSNIGLATGTSVSVKDTSNAVSGSASTLEFPDGSLTNMGSGLFKVSPKGPYISKNFISYESINVGDSVFFDTASGKVRKYYGTPTSVSINLNQLLGFAMSATSGADENIEILIWGIASIFSGLTSGSLYFLSSSNTIDTKNSASRYKIGYALDSSTLFFNNEYKKCNIPIATTAFNVYNLTTVNTTRSSFVVNQFSGYNKYGFIGTFGTTSPDGIPSIEFQSVNTDCYVEVKILDSSSNILDKQMIYPFSSSCFINLRNIKLFSTSNTLVNEIKFEIIGLTTGQAVLRCGALEIEGI